MIAGASPDEDFFYQPPSVTSEDCLYLNIWRPASRNGKLPVMVWIHGGGWVQGSGAHPLYDGAKLARKGVIVVTLNYRLGIFGRFSHPELSREAPSGVSGNYDLSDILQALRWIRANISAFDGDADCVTIFGESVGASYVSLLTVMPLARGLFHRAIAQSGGAFYRDYPERAASDAEGVAFAERISRPTLADLRAISANDLQTLSRSMPPTMSAVVGDDLLPDQPREMAHRGEMARVPVISGSNGAESFRTKQFANIKDSSSYEFAIRQIYEADGARIFNHFSPNKWREGLTDQERYGPLAARAEDFAHHPSGNAYLYHFNHSDGDFPAFHTAEIPYVFDNLSLSARYSSNMPPVERVQSNQAMAEYISNYWIAFARTGELFVEGQPEWLPYHRNTGGAFMTFQEGATLKQGFPLRI